ncbi:hypothetical protein F5Y16DRAFT_364088 [Xylariaceae sp. FL0255]|nr:hypothetical protein F5Y16DRAFT_364088 [Xylariaceae sp. FL0255]
MTTWGNDADSTASSEFELMEKDQQPSPPPKAKTAPARGRDTPISTEPVEFRGFDFFAQRDFNQLKDASQAYFATATAGGKSGEQGNASWLGDATPPGTAYDQPLRPGTFPIPPGGKTPRKVEKRILGLRKPVFWIVLAIILVVLVVAIGVGAGVGASRNSSNSSKGAGGSASTSTTSASSSSSTIMSDTTTATSSPSSSSRTLASSTSSPSPTSGVQSTGCPGMNNTIYSVPGSTLQYRRYCGIDYSGDGTVDIKSIPTENEASCIANCAGTPECTGCGWGYISGGPTSDFTCYLKRNLTVQHTADPNWVFAIQLL